MSSNVNIEKLFDLHKNQYSWHDNVIVIGGATSVGKSKIAVDLAKRINGAIINADSVQVYKGLNILSSRPTISEMGEVPHYLYGYVENNINFSVSAKT